MKLADLVAEIRKDSKNELARLDYGLENQIMDLEQCARLEKLQLKEEAQKEIERKTQNIKKEILGIAALECKKNTLKEKKQIVNKAIELGIKKLMSQKKYEDFLKKQIKPKAKIYGNKKDKALLKVLKKKQLIEADIKGGIIVKKDNVTTDNSIERIVEKNRALEGRIQRFLFKGD